MLLCNGSVCELSYSSWNKREPMVPPSPLLIYRFFNKRRRREGNRKFPPIEQKRLPCKNTLMVGIQLYFLGLGNHPTIGNPSVGRYPIP